MTTAVNSFSSVAADWLNARSLYPVYEALTREFVVEIPACDELRDGVDAPSQEAAAQARQWLQGVDDRIQVHQLRQFLQNTPLANEAMLRELLVHHLGKAKHGDSDRDKIDFLLVQYFALVAPVEFAGSSPSIDAVAEILNPVIGKALGGIPEAALQLDEYLQQASSYTSLNELFTSRLIEKGRTIKASVGDEFYLPISLAAFTRFSFLMRKIFFRLLHQDLDAISDGLRALEQEGVTSLDCRKAQFSDDESIHRLRLICQSWKVMFQAEYSSGQALAMLTDLRMVIDAAVAKQTPAESNAAVPALHKSVAAAAAAGGSEINQPPASPVANSEPVHMALPADAAKPAEEAAEFDISVSDWDPDANAN